MKKEERLEVLRGILHRMQDEKQRLETKEEFKLRFLENGTLDPFHNWPKSFTVDEASKLKFDETVFEKQKLTKEVESVS